MAKKVTRKKARKAQRPPSPKPWDGFRLRVPKNVRMVDASKWEPVSDVDEIGLYPLRPWEDD